MRLARADEKPARTRCQRCDWLSGLDPELINLYDDERRVEALLPLESRTRKGATT